jgi:hypothetical protein
MRLWDEVVKAKKDEIFAWERLSVEGHFQSGTGTQGQVCGRKDIWFGCKIYLDIT